MDPLQRPPTTVPAGMVCRLFKSGHHHQCARLNTIECFVNQPVYQWEGSRWDSLHRLQHSFGNWAGWHRGHGGFITDRLTLFTKEQHCSVWVTKVRLGRSRANDMQSLRLAFETDGVCIIPLLVICHSWTDSISSGRIATYWPGGWSGHIGVNNWTPW